MLCNRHHTCPFEVTSILHFNFIYKNTGTCYGNLTLFCSLPSTPLHLHSPDICQYEPQYQISLNSKWSTQMNIQIQPPCNMWTEYTEKSLFINTAPHFICWHMSLSWFFRFYFILQFFLNCMITYCTTLNWLIILNANIQRILRNKKKSVNIIYYYVSTISIPSVMRAE